MTDQKTPALAEAEATPEQRAAWLRLSDDPRVRDVPHKPGATVKSDAALIAPLLPKSLTTVPTLPTATWTAWSDSNGDLWVVDGVGKLYCPSDTAMRAEDYAPFRPLVPERPYLSRGEAEAGAAKLWNSERVEVEEEAREFTLTELTRLARAIAAGGDQ